MQAIYYLIKRSTLVEIADAIREVKGLDSSIPVSKLDDVLRGILSRSTARSTEHEEYLIKLQTLIDIADAARELLGTSERIVVRELAKRILDILNAKKQLATPYIWLETVDEPVGDRTPAILGVAILGKTILGDYSTGLPQLRAPVIYLEEVSELPRLATPVIYLEEIEEGGDTPEEPMQLEAPVIYLEEIDDGEIVLFDADVTTSETSFGTMSHATIISSEPLLEPCKLGYIVTIDDVEYILDGEIDGDNGDVWWNGRVYSTKLFVVQNEQGTAIVSQLLGVDGEIHHIKISYKEESLGLTKLDTPVIYLEEVDDGESEEPEGPVQLEAPVIRLEEVEVVPAKLAAPLIYLEHVAFEGEVTTAYYENVSFGGATFNGLCIVIDEELLDSSVDSYTVEIYGVEYVCKLTLDDYMWSVTENPFAEDNTIILSKTGDSRTLIASTLFAEAGEVHRIKITETVEKPVSYIGTTWKFPRSLDVDAMADYIRTYGEEWLGYPKGMLAFNIRFSINGSIDGTSDYERMEFHNNGDEGDSIHYHYSADPAEDYVYAGAWGVEPAFDDGADVITLKEEPSEALLGFLQTLASRAYLIPSGDYALTTSPAEDVYAILDAAELENVLPFSIYVKFTNVTEAGENSGLEFDHIDITEDGVVYVYDDDPDYYCECYADPDDGDLTYFTVIEDTYVSETEYKVFNALKLYDSNLENDN